MADRRQGYYPPRGRGRGNFGFGQSSQPQYASRPRVPYAQNASRIPPPQTYQGDSNQYRPLKRFPPGQDRNPGFSTGNSQPYADASGYANVACQATPHGENGVPQSTVHSPAKRIEQRREHLLRNESGSSQDDQNSSLSVGLASGEEKFNAAAIEHQQSLQTHLAADKNYESSSEEEDLDNDKILNNLSKAFIANEGASDSLEKTKDYLMNTITSKASACLICIETIKRNDAIWNCLCCYTSFHVTCIQKWVKDGVFQQTVHNDNVNVKDVTWCCPKCRREYTQPECPTRYFCYCGKQQDPVFEPWLVPHSCGDHCSRPLIPHCGHQCLLLCHPGPCPPCPQTVRSQCYCGRAQAQRRRCSAKEWSCGAMCGRKLACGQHQCNKACHTGECPPCPSRSKQPCRCGKKQQERLCAQKDWQCETVCGLSLSCGHHNCAQVCHKGDCDPCPKSGKRKCPCGKTVFDLPCTEESPTCLDTCGKLLECGKHACAQRCHQGPCGTCRAMVTKSCLCGRKQKQVQCYKDYQCDTKCNRMKDCGKHQCKRKCCDGQCPPCDLPCGRMLGCRNHKCSSRCHRGPCYPCPQMVTVQCSCGQTHLRVPCGRERATKPPKCTKTCSVPPDCHHSTRQSHECHFNPCPPCQLICNKPLSGCKHPCPQKCHSAVRTVVKTKVAERAGPWDAAPETKEELVCTPCPPCQVLVAVFCLGKHEKMQMPCSIARVTCCGRKCGRLLSCSNHQCMLNCHEVIGAPDDAQAGTNCGTCEEICSKPRPDGCNHPCLRPCHPGDCAPCSLMIRMRCHCQTMVKHIECDRWTHADDIERIRLQSCGSTCPKLLKCGHQCHLICHAGQCPSPERCVETIKVRCPCKRRVLDFLCNDQYLGDAVTECDDECEDAKQLKLKEKKEAEERKARQAEEQKQRELQEYERRQQNKKTRNRRKRHTDEEEEDRPYIKKNLIFILVPFLVIMVGLFITYLVQVSYDD